ncbi:uncharacterized protein LOC143887960 [Tasmannia lanceolata]|uniref:uncharacterized protein LOC143887960 n=1 Tax=Tasmannia lanceolata TaxID=3420 RepID=UPI0040636496
MEFPKEKTSKLSLSSSPSLSAIPSPKTSGSESYMKNIQDPFRVFSDSSSKPQKPKSSDKPLRVSEKLHVGFEALDQISSTDGYSDAHFSIDGRGFNSDDEKSSRNKWDDAGFVQSPTCFSSFARIRYCDVYIGFHGRMPSLLRFVNWLRAELELQGISCFMADRSRCRDDQDRLIADRVMNAATLGVIILTQKSFSNFYVIDELRSFLGRKNLVPIFFGLKSKDCVARGIIERRGDIWVKHGGALWMSYGGSEGDWREAIDGLSCMRESKFEAHPGNWRDCISEAIVHLGMRLGRRGVLERVNKWKEMVEKEEFLFPRNGNFVGRKEELLELELILFGDVDGNGETELFELKTSHKQNSSSMGRSKKNGVVKESEEKSLDESKRKGKEVAVWKESEEKIEMQGIWSPPSHYRTSRGKSGGRHGRRWRSKNILYGKGVACVSGISGIGKTELLLEFAYKVSQRYRMVLWLGGEARYVHQNYMNLLSFLGVDVSIENHLCPESNGPKSFEEMEEEAIRRVRKEFMRDIPFLLVIDNLEDEKNWWDKRSIMDLLPRFGGETHVIISTRKPRILNLEPLKLSYLFEAEAMSLMKGRLQDLPWEDNDALRVINEKLGGLTLGLALVGAILSELPISASKLLNTITRMPARDLTWGDQEDSVLRDNPFLIQLLDVCFSIFNIADRPWNLATRMVLASGWFAPSPIPVSLLDLAASEDLEKHGISHLWKKCRNAVTCGRFACHTKKSKDEASTMLVMFRIARRSTRHDSINVHDIVKLYARKSAGIGVARAMVQAIIVKGSLPRDADHIWAACFLLFKFGKDPAIIKLEVPDLLSFTRRFVLPLAIQTFTTYVQCNAALELLRLCTDELEAVEESYLSHIKKGLEKSLCWQSSFQQPTNLNPAVYKELTLLKATLLETRAKLMLQGGQYDIGEQLCRTAISIREVICGWDHLETVSARETMMELVRFQINF